MTKEKEGTMKKLWKATGIPEAIKDKKEENKIKKEIMKEARKEALQELKPELIKQIKQQELDKMSGKKKKDFLKKLADGFKMDSLGSDDKVAKMLGRQTTTKKDNEEEEGNAGPSNDRIKKMLGK